MEKTLSFFNCTFIFRILCVCVSYFFFFCSAFSGVFIFGGFPTTKKTWKNLSLENIFFFTNFFFLNLFFGGKHYWIFCSKIIIWNFCQKKDFFKKKKTKNKNKNFFIHMRRRAHTHLKALFTIAASRDVVERVSPCAFSCHWSRPRDIRCINPSLLFFLFFFFKKILLFSNCFFSDFASQFFHGTTSLFTLFISFFYLVSCPFFLSSCFVKGIWWQKTKHVIKRNEWKQWWEWSPRSEKRRSLLLACFWAWLKVWVDGPASTKENASADCFWQGLAAIVCFLWFTALCATQTVCRTPASQGLSSSPYVLSLSTNVLLMFTQDGQLEAVKLNLEDSTVCV